MIANRLDGLWQSIDLLDPLIFSIVAIFINLENICMGDANVIFVFDFKQKVSFIILAYLKRNHFKEYNTLFVNLVIKISLIYQHDLSTQIIMI